MRPLAYHRAESLDQARALHQAAEDPRWIAGGQTLMPVLRLRLDAPSDLIDIGRIPGLSGIETTPAGTTIGALTPHAAVAASTEVPPALAFLAGRIADPLVRNRGTVGGNLAGNDPASDWTAAALALGATIVTDRRDIAAADFLTGMLETALEPSELITGLRFRTPDRAGYARFKNPASRYPLVGVFVADRRGEVRVAITGAAPLAFRAVDFEAALNRRFDPDGLSDVALRADGLNDDRQASAPYRAHLAGVLARRAVARALGRD